MLSMPVTSPAFMFGRVVVDDGVDEVVDEESNSAGIEVSSPRMRFTNGGVVVDVEGWFTVVEELPTGDVN